MKVRVDSETCVGHGRCYEIAPEVFGDDERGHCVILMPQVAKQHYDAARKAEWPDPPMGLHTWSIPRKDGDPCPRCSGPISGTRIRARGTYFCPRCQR